MARSVSPLVGRCLRTALPRPPTANPRPSSSRAVHAIPARAPLFPLPLPPPFSALFVTPVCGHHHPFLSLRYLSVTHLLFLLSFSPSSRGALPSFLLSLRPSGTGLSHTINRFSTTNYGLSSRFGIGLLHPPPFLFSLWRPLVASLPPLFLLPFWLPPVASPLGGLATMWSAEDVLDGQRQRVDIPPHARTADKGLLQESLEEDLG